MMKKSTNAISQLEAVGPPTSSVTLPPKIEFLLKMEEFAKLALKKYKENTLCTLVKRLIKFYPLIFLVLILSVF